MCQIEIRGQHLLIATAEIANKHKSVAQHIDNRIEVELVAARFKISGRSVTLRHVLPSSISGKTFMLQILVVPVTEFQQNCSIIYDDQSLEAIVLDPGGEAEKIAAEAKRLGVTVQAIWLTHGHLDHAGGAEALKKILDVQIIGPHEADKMLLDNIVTVAAGYGVTGMQNAQPDRWLSEGDTVSVGPHQFEIIHTPGHAPGHVIFVNHQEKLILMGDVLFQGSIGRTDLPGGNHQQLMDSIANKILPLGDELKFVCGHSPSSTLGQEKATNPYLASLK